MDKPEPIPLRFLDVVFGDGVPDQSLTLWPKDELEIGTDRLLVRFHEKSEELIVMHLAHVRLYSVREGVYLPPPAKRLEVPA